MTRPRIESRSPGPLTNILPTRPMSRLTFLVVVAKYSFFFFFFYIWSYRIRIIFWPIYLTNIWDLKRYHHPGSDWTREEWQWRGTPHCPDLQNWILIIRFSLVPLPGHSESLVMSYGFASSNRNELRIKHNTHSHQEINKMYNFKYIVRNREYVLVRRGKLVT